ncbi:DUF397 domain-containing protein [Actinoplanes sp. CA-051413]|uniref:DUF397 domain-containing protein n=1 Tax=Actinoplanes sp. CA-051413 TaxID=3239899 RepID=UPI003D976576
MDTLDWRKSSRSSSGNCVEVAHSTGVIMVRDSKDTAGPVLAFGPAGWRQFIAGIRVGVFDRR